MASVVGSEGHLEFESAGGVLLPTGGGAPGSRTVPERSQAPIPATPASFDVLCPLFGDIDNYSFMCGTCVPLLGQYVACQK